MSSVVCGKIRVFNTTSLVSSTAVTPEAFSHILPVQKPFFISVGSMWVDEKRFPW